MSIYFNAIIMLALTVAAFMLLAKLFQAIRSGRIVPPWRAAGLSPAMAARVVIEQICAIDSKRRLVLIRCDEQRLVLVTGGPTDLISLLPILRGTGDGQ